MQTTIIKAISPSATLICFKAELRPVLIAIILVLITGCGRHDELQLRPVRAADILAQASSHSGAEAVLINFWGTWCAPCVAEFPQIVELSTTYHDDGLVVYFVSVDWLEETERVKEFLIAHGVQGISYIKDEKDNPFINAINNEWSGAVPFTVLYGRSTGELTDYWEGEASREKFVAAIEVALEH